MNNTPVNTIMEIINIILLTVFILNILYLFVFAIGSKFNPVKINKNTEVYKKIAILIPAYKEDSVIEECVNSCLQQDYPTEKFTVVVISDKMKDETNKRLSQLIIKLIIADYDNSTKSKALNLAMSKIEDHDIAVVFDADNTIDRDFLININKEFSVSNVKIVQAHRVAKNLNNSMAVLDAVSEETNNSIFRLGHSNLGLSAALIGSGMAFDYLLFKNKMSTINAVGGFDRNLELSFLRDGIKIGYLPEVLVYDEKVQSQAAFSNQRKRWMSAQIHYFVEFRNDFFKSLLSGNIDFCNKYVQQMAIPRILLIGLTFILALINTLTSSYFTLIWWMLLVLLAFTMFLAIPSELIDKRLLKAITSLPKVFFLMFINLFKLKGANKKFIHTPHGIDTN